MIEIKATVYADELLVQLNNFPKNIQDELRNKFEQIFARVEQELFNKTPGQFLDKSFISSGTTDLGSSVIGFIEATDKPGVYPIPMSRAKLIQLATGQKVWARQVLNHPYLKASPLVARAIEESKPWILEELNDAAQKAISRGGR